MLVKMLVVGSGNMKKTVIILFTMVSTAFFVGCNSETKQMSDQECKDSYLVLKNMQREYNGDEADKNKIISFREELNIKCSDFAKRDYEQSIKGFDIDLNAGQSASGRKW